MNSANPILSIITPTWNPDMDSFQKTAESVLSAIHPDWEWVIMVHNSAPEVTEMIRKLTGGRENIRILEKHDDTHSPSVPRNEGIRRARGKYIYLLDHDDVIEKGFLETAVERMEQEKCDILIGRCEKKLNEEGLYEVPMVLDFPETDQECVQVPDDPDIKGRLLYGAPVMLACKVIRRELLIINGIYFDDDIMLAEDFLFTLRCFCRTKKICVMPKLTAYTYVQHEGSLLQRMMGEDSFPVETYTEPVRRTVKLALENNISPSHYVWIMMGMFTVIYQKSSMSPEKKRQMMTEIQQYIPLLKFDGRRKPKSWE